MQESVLRPLSCRSMMHIAIRAYSCIEAPINR